MKSNVLSDTRRMTKKEFLLEADRLLAETQMFLDNARRTQEESKRIGEENQQVLADLERRILCGKS